MKTALFALFLTGVAFGPASAQAPDSPKAAPCPSCDKGTSRLAVLTGAAACPEDCQKPCCRGEMLEFKITAMGEEGRAQAIQDKLAAIPKVWQVDVCQNSGTVKVRCDTDAVTPAKLVETVAATGATVSGQQITFAVAGMTCSGCSAKLAQALARTEGVAEAKEVSHVTGTATVLFDPSKTDEKKLTAVIHKNGYKVKEG